MTASLTQKKYSKCLQCKYITNTNACTELCTNIETNVKTELRFGRNVTSKNRDSENQRLHCISKNEKKRFAELIRNSLSRKELFTFSSNRKMREGGISENWEHRTSPSIACSKTVKAMWLPPSWRNALRCRVRGRTRRRRNKEKDDVTKIYIQWKSTKLVSTLLYCTHYIYIYIYICMYLDMRSVINIPVPLNKSKFQEAVEQLMHI
jgi:hypothetical protein